MEINNRPSNKKIYSNKLYKIDTHNKFHYTKSIDDVIKKLNIFLRFIINNNLINENNYEDIIKTCYNILLEIKDKSLQEINLLLIMLFLENCILHINDVYTITI